MKLIILVIAAFFVGLTAEAQTQFVKTNEQLKNGDFVYEVRFNDQRVGEFLPVRGMNLVTKQTDRSVFTGNLKDIQKKLPSGGNCSRWYDCRFGWFVSNARQIVI